MCGKKESEPGYEGSRLPGSFPHRVRRLCLYIDHDGMMKCAGLPTSGGGVEVFLVNY